MVAASLAPLGMTMVGGVETEPEKRNSRSAEEDGGVNPPLQRRGVRKEKREKGKWREGKMDEGELENSKKNEGSEEDKWNRKKVGEGAKVSEKCADERIERGARAFPEPRRAVVRQKEPRQ